MPSSMRNRRPALILAAILAASFMTLAAACSGDDDDDDTTPGTTPEETSAAGPQSEHGQLIARAELPLGLADGTSIGNADAPVVIEAFEDFGCPHCLHFTATAEPRLLDDYVARGKVRLVYRYFPLQQLTANAAIAAQCAAEQDRFWEYHKELFIAQAEAANGTGPALAAAFAPAGLRDLAGRLGLDPAAFETCLTGDSAVAKVTEDYRAGQTLGLRGTPSFVVNGQVLTGNPEKYEDWKQLLDGLLK